VLAVTGVAPPSGSTAGDTSVVITGSGFLKDATVTFGGEPGKVTEVTPMSIKVGAPKHAAGPVDVVVENPDKKSHTLTGGFFYFDPKTSPRPVVTSISPSAGPLSGGQSVTISGSGLSGVATVSFGGTPASSVRILSDTTLAVVTAPRGEGKADVVVGDGTSVTVTAGYAYVCGVGSTSRLFLMVALAGALGGTVHAIRSLFWYVGNRDLRWSWSLMYVLLPISGGAIGIVFFLIASVGFYTTAQGTGSFVLVGLAALVGMFSVQAAEKLKSIAEGLLAPAPQGKDSVKAQAKLSVADVIPGAGPAAGGTPVTVTGSGFAVGVTVKFGNTVATEIKRESDTVIKLKSPPHTAQLVDVVVTNPDKATATKAGGYTYKEGGEA
jgi:hypothetical protein